MEANHRPLGLESKFRFGREGLISGSWANLIYASMLEMCRRHCLIPLTDILTS